jgi:hypothetical protein
MREHPDTPDRGIVRAAVISVGIALAITAAAGIGAWILTR